jgi:hypothetical protein
MKSFLQYLTESKQDYSFRVVFAGKPEAGIGKTIKTALAGYSVKSVSDAKSHMIERSHPFFPDLQNPEIYTIDVVCEYPATSTQIRKSLTDHSVDKATVAVENLAFAEDIAAEAEAIKTNTGEKPLLLKDYEKVKVDHPYGDNYNAKLVKNSVTGTGQVKIKGGAKPAETTNDLKAGTKSPVGSHKPKLPSVKDIKR